MTNLLDAAIAATPPSSRGGPKIVSENHDINSINWVRGMSDPGEMIACGAYQQLRRLAGESDIVYQKRINMELMKLPAHHREQIIKAGRDAAIKRAGYDTSNGKVAVFAAGKPVWGEVGINIESATDSKNAQELSQTGFSVEKEQLYYRNPVTGEMTPIDGQFGLIRKDTGKNLSKKSVGNIYQVLDNGAAFAFVDEVMKEFGAKYVSAGSLFGGQQVFMTVELPEHSFTLNGVDRTDAFATFVAYHDGCTASKCIPANFRVECNNTLRRAVKGARGRGLSIRHTGDIKARVTEARRCLNISISEMDKYAESAEFLAKTPVDPLVYFDGLLDVVTDITLADSLKGGDMLAASLLVTDAERKIEAAKFETKIEKRKSLLDDLLERYEQEDNGIGGMRGTGWSAFNAATSSADWGLLGGRQTGTEKKSRRFESVLTGKADKIKQVALEQVMLMAGAN